MTQLEVNKLKAKIAKQQDKENKKSWNYVGSQKKASRVTYSRNGLYRHQNIDTKEIFEVVINGKIYKKVVK